MSELLGKHGWGGPIGERVAQPSAGHFRACHAWGTLSVLGAWFGVSFAAPVQVVSGLHPAQVRGLFVLAVGTLVLGVLLGLSADVNAGGGRRLLRGLERVWFIGLPLALLPACSGDLAVLPALASTLLAVRFGPRGALAQLTERRAWRGAVLAFAACFTPAFIAAGSASPGSVDNDPAYYYGVARHMVHTHHWSEPIVWQFASHAAKLTHAPFDYWHGLVSLFLVPIMALFGSTHHVAGAAVGAVSGLSIVLFAYLLVVAAPLRNAALQVLSVVLFACSPALASCRVSVETIQFVHVFLLLGLIALARRKLLSAVAFGCLAFLARADAATLATLLCLGAAYYALESARPVRTLARVAAGVLGFGVLYVGYHWVMFRSPGPPGALLAARLVDGTAIYHGLGEPSTWTLAQRFAPTFVADRVQVAFNTVQQVNFFPYYPVWLGFAFISALPSNSARRGVDAVSRCMLFVGAAGVALASPAVFAWYRSLHTLLPVFVASGAYGAERVLDALSRIIERASARARLAEYGVALSTLWLSLGLLRPLHLTIETLAEPAFAKEFAALEDTLQGEPVMSNRSWFVLAYTRAPVVQLPFDGEQAIASVIHRYGIKWLLLVNGENTLGSTDAVNALQTGQRSDLGGVRLTRTRSAPGTTLYRVE